MRMVGGRHGGIRSWVLGIINDEGRLETPAQEISILFLVFRKGARVSGRSG